MEVSKPDPNNLSTTKIISKFNNLTSNAVDSLSFQVFLTSSTNEMNKIQPLFLRTVLVIFILFINCRLLFLSI